MNFWNKPYYMFRPQQMWVRLKLGLAPTGIREVVLPWGVRMEVDAEEFIGRTIVLQGVFDLVVSETLWRLLEPGEAAVDAGANIGYMTSILAVRAGSAGRVYVFEPNPRICSRLHANVTRFVSSPHVGHIVVSASGLSNRTGEMFLQLGKAFEVNQGLAALQPEVQSGDTDRSFPVRLVPLDEALAQELHVGILKMDVEGHELAVLQGASRFLKERRIRDIVFESHENYPTAVSDLLESQGYHLYQLTRDFWGIHIKPPTGTLDRSRFDESPSYLATLEPERAVQRLRRKGWMVLGW